MKFIIPKDTPATVYSWGELGCESAKVRTTKENVFAETDVVIDPNGHLGAGPQTRTIGGSMATDGLYGFRRGEKCLVVHHERVILQGVYETVYHAEMSEAGE